jgi:hypothetical protein
MCHCTGDSHNTITGDGAAFSGSEPSVEAVDMSIFADVLEGVGVMYKRLVVYPWRPA